MRGVVVGKRLEHLPTPNTATEKPARVSRSNESFSFVVVWGGVEWRGSGGGSEEGEAGEGQAHVADGVTHRAQPVENWSREAAAGDEWGLRVDVQRVVVAR